MPWLGLQRLGPRTERGGPSLCLTCSGTTTLSGSLQASHTHLPLGPINTSPFSSPAPQGSSTIPCQLLWGTGLEGPQEEGLWVH